MNARRLAPALGVALSLVLVLTGCSTIKDLTGIDLNPGAAPESVAASSSVSSAADVFTSEFTRDGTYTSHTKKSGVDYVLTVWPSKKTPWTNQWRPSGSKFFSFTFQAYDTNVPLRSKFSKKRKVYLADVTVTSVTQTTSGNTTSPLTLALNPLKDSWDPSPTTSKYGALITNPKGTFERRNEEIGSLDADTYGLTLTFAFNVKTETKAGSKKYTKNTITVQVPIRIYLSSEPTASQKTNQDDN